jgi:hypothetical protein
MPGANPNEEKSDHLSKERKKEEFGRLNSQKKKGYSLHYALVDSWGQFSWSIPWQVKVERLRSVFFPFWDVE